MYTCSLILSRERRNLIHAMSVTRIEDCLNDIILGFLLFISLYAKHFGQESNQTLHMEHKFQPAFTSIADRGAV